MRKRKNSGSSCGSSHSTETVSNAAMTPENDEIMQAFMLEEYSMDSEKKSASRLVYLPINRHCADESAFEIKLKIRPLTKDELEKPKLEKQLCEPIARNETSTPSEISTSNSNVANNVVNNEKVATVDSSEDANVEISLKKI